MAKPKSTIKKIKIVANLSEDVVAQINAYADEMGINRTSAISILCSSALKSEKAVSEVSELLTEIKKIQSKD